ncbi:MAG: chloride channel protein [Gammaproteobacteria bacterium]|nr:chloride channel protein [Gammaproteobacteria bacterium]MBU1656389.1 chloride channel protein [Gammaproteobacteria bacterium]MBU1960937.1 chloride channel protein [Gammaproteobacteria bacterium]
MRQRIRQTGRRLLSPLAWQVRGVFWLGAILVGLFCTLFALLSDQADHLFRRIAAFHPLLPLAVTPLGLMLVAWATRNLLPGSQGSGIPQAIAALEMRRRELVLNLRIAFGKILLTVLGLASGASIGREGPSVHVGAALMYSLGGWARFPPHYMERGLILAGGAAGIAAAFNTPLAGIVFAIEEMSRSFEHRTNGMVTTAVILAGLTALTVTGPYHYFGQSGAVLGSLEHWIAVPLCGIAGGLLGGFFSHVLIQGGRRLAPFAGRYPVLLAGACGLVVALLGLASGNSVNGTGYEAAKSIIAEGVPLDPFYPLTKMGATLASYFSGIPGGIFAPSLATGAGVGADLGHWLPVAPLSVMVLLGMLAYFCGVVQAPLTAFIIVMEMTANQDMLLALMATSLIAFASSKLVCPQPLYQTLAMNFLALDAEDNPRGRPHGNP